MLFRARQFEFVFPRPALVMGVVNVTPDSFSDGGKFLDPAAAVAHALKLVEQGAEILDIGGESTRPGAQPVSEAEELRRVIPVIQKLAQIKIPISIDTTKPAVAAAALQAGASIVNDVAAHHDKNELWKTVAEFEAGYICMHAQGEPQTMQQNPVYTDVVREVGEFFQERMGTLLNSAGIMPGQVVLDAGIGFGKTPEHNLQLLANLRSFTKLQRPLLIGVSRKSFIGNLLGAAVDERLPASLACAILAVEAGVQFIRTHDVAETVQAVRMAEAVLARKKI
ncbi:MAG: dihydropteroate synthase [Verrucomicrobiales bacterium]|nr:dihydropteroate synthase [Verrucomicrobiales bacterium]